MGTVLPDYLSSVALRLGRVDELAEDIAELCFAFVRSDPLELRERRAGGKASLFVHGIDQVPPAIGLVFSDAINQLRSVLDNALVLVIEMERGVSLTGPAERAAQFLIYDDETKYRTALRRLVAHLPELAVDAPLGKRIYELQPFRPLEQIRQMRTRRSVTAHGGHHLRVLQEYSNADKHRRPHVFAVGNAVTRAATGAVKVGVENVSQLEIGQVVSSTSLGASGVVEIWPFVGVHRTLADELVPPGAELCELHRYMAEIALPRLAGLPEGAVFPPGVDLRSLRISDAERVATAESTYAHERLGFRFALEMRQVELDAQREGRGTIRVPRQED